MTNFAEIVNIHINGAQSNWKNDSKSYGKLNSQFKLKVGMYWHVY